MMNEKELNLNFEKLVSEYERMIWDLSFKNKKRHCTILEVEELYQYGLIGLWKAHEGFEEGRGVKFSTYAYVNIDGYIRNGISKFKEIDISRSKVKLKEQMSQIMNMKEEKNWSWEETKKQSGLNDKEWLEALELNKKMLYIDSYVKRNAGEEMESSVLEIIPSEYGIEEKIMNKELIKEILSHLDAVEKEIVNYRYIKGYNKKECANILNIPVSSFSRKEEKMLAKLKVKIDLPYG